MTTLEGAQSVAQRWAKKLWITHFIWNPLVTLPNKVVIGIFFPTIFFFNAEGHLDALLSPVGKIEGNLTKTDAEPSSYS